MNKSIFSIVILLLLLATLITCSTFKYEMDPNEDIVDSSKQQATPAGAPKAADQQKIEQPKAVSEQTEQKPVAANENSAEKKSEGKPETRAEAPVEQKSTSEQKPVTTEQKSVPTTAAPAVKLNPAMIPKGVTSQCPNIGLFGASNIKGEGRPIIQHDKKDCRLCSVDCSKIWMFNPNYNLNWFTKAPTKAAVIKGSTCKCRYYNFGCDKKTHCPSYSTIDELYAAAVFCVIHNGCEVNNDIRNEIGFKDAMRRFAAIGESIKKTKSALMRVETKILEELGVRTPLIFHFKRVQDAVDHIMLGHDYQRFLNSPEGQWDLNKIPEYMKGAVKPFPVTERLYNRIAFKLRVEKYLPESDTLALIRKYAEDNLRLNIEVNKNLDIVKRKSLNLFRTLEAAYNLGNAYFDLLQNQIDSVRVGLYQTFETKEQEDANKIEVEKEIARRAASNKRLAEISLFKLLLGKSWGERLEALKNLSKILVEEWNAKVQVYLNSVAGKVSDAALLAAANVKNGALKAARKVTGYASEAAYVAAKGGKFLADNTVKYGKIAGKHVARIGKKAFNKVKGGAKKAISKVKGGAKRALGKVKGIGKKAKKTIRKLKGGFKKIGGGAKRAVSRVSGGFKRIGGGAKRAFSRVSRGFRRFFRF